MKKTFFLSIAIISFYGELLYSSNAIIKKFSQKDLCNLISIAIPTFRNFEFLKYSISSYLFEPLISEIVVVDDAFSRDAEQISLWLEASNFSATQKAKITIHSSDKKRGALKNKIRAISLCKGEWVALIDSDNFIDKHYLNPLVHYWQFLNPLNIPPTTAKTFIFAPELLRMATNFSSETIQYFNFTSVRLEVGDINSKTWDTIRYHKWANAFLNTGNYVVHAPTILNVWHSLAQDDLLEPFGMDVLVMNKVAVQAGMTITTIPNSMYCHTIGHSSLWSDTESASLEFLKNFNWNL